jgi:hypothetical protein
MEKDFNLYQHLIKMVEQQIETNTPPATKETYTRLVNSGYDGETAKEKIAVIIAEEIYAMMGTEDKKLDLAHYAEKLSQIE